MQTPAEQSLIRHTGEALRRHGGDSALMINIGAAQSVVIEEALIKAGYRFICDRVDIDPCTVAAPYVGRTFQSSIEEMPAVPTAAYDLGFANFVLEHVPDIRAAISELGRIFKPGAAFIVSTPNPAAPEFIISSYTPLAFHQFMRGDKEEAGHHAYETAYAYKSIPDLIAMFAAESFTCERADYFSFTEGYLHRFPVLNLLSRLYDKLVMLTGWKRLHGNVCLVFKKQ